MSGPRVRLVKPGKWFWLEEYVNVNATYWLSCPTNRTVEYGSGVFAGGKPLGERHKFSGSRKVGVMGLGSIHVCIADGGGPCEVGIWQTEFSVGTWDVSRFGAISAAVAAGDADAHKAGRE